VKVFANDPDLRVRSAAAITLAELGEGSEEFLTALRLAIGAENPQIKKAAFAALALLEKKGPLHPCAKKRPVERTPR